ncbi:MAG: serine hydrolase [Proteobacteria bacterium]|nr:serine hydrolase [Pseudomonadota bacterium]MDA1022691.1 serine hydrolase [Pseudomonadota bacterium]
MRLFLKRLLVPVALAIVVFAFVAPAQAKYSSLVMDAETGQIIHQLNADTRNYPASLTKMMTLYQVFQALESQLWTLNTRLRISARAARQPASKLGLRRGQRISVQDAILALVTKSANDVATTVAENLSGSERAFALKMTATARKLGMSRTTFRNASGLPHRGQMSTARDMATLARALLRDYPVYYRYFSANAFDYDGITHRNHNKLLETYAGVDGIKTGYIRASGFNLVASATRNGQRIIGVVFGGNSPNSRNAIMKRLLNIGFKAVNKGGTTEMAQAPAPEPVAEAPTKSPPGATRTARPTSLAPVPEDRRWGVQVGAYARYSQAFQAAERALETASALLAEGAIKIVPLKKRGGRILHRARIKGISEEQAQKACRYLIQHNTNCMKIKMRDGYRMAFNDRG